MLTKEILLKIAEAIGNGRDWPQQTGDPVANYYMDHLLDVEPWESLSNEEKRIYLEDAKTE